MNNKGNTSEAAVPGFLQVDTAGAVGHVIGKSSYFPLLPTLPPNPAQPTRTETNLQFMQLLTEAPAIGVDPGYGVVTEVKLVQR